MAPAGTPQAVVDRLSAEVGKIITSPAGRDELVRLAVEPDFRPAGDLAAFMRSELDKWGQVVRETHMPPIE